MSFVKQLHDVYLDDVIVTALRTGRFLILGVAKISVGWSRCPNKNVG